MIESSVLEARQYDIYGYCHYCIYSDKKALIYNLYTEPQYRRHGNAKRRLKYTIELIRATGFVGEIEIEVMPRERSISRTNLEKFYRSLNLKIIGGENENSN